MIALAFVVGVASIIAAGVWAWNRNKRPDQWTRYRGVAELRERNDVIDSALLSQQLRNGVLESSAGVFFLWPPVQCVACKRMAAIVRRTDAGAKCSACHG